MKFRFEPSERSVSVSAGPGSQLIQAGGVLDIRPGHTVVVQGERIAYEDYLRRRFLGVDGAPCLVPLDEAAAPGAVQMRAPPAEVQPNPPPAPRILELAPMPAAAPPATPAPMTRPAPAAPARPAPTRPAPPVRGHQGGRSR